MGVLAGNQAYSISNCHGSNPYKYRYMADESEKEDDPSEVEKTSEELAEAKAQLEKDIHGLTEAKGGLVGDVAELRETRRDLRSTEAPVVEEKKIETPEDLIEEAKKVSAEQVAGVKSDVQTLRDVQKKKGKRLFLQSAQGKEYSTEADPDDVKFNALIEKAQKLGDTSDEYDADLYSDRLQEAHAALNYKSNADVVQQAKVQKAESENAAATIAASTGGASSTTIEIDDSHITDFDRRQATKMGKTPHEVAALRIQYEESLMTP